MGVVVKLERKCLGCGKGFAPRDRWQKVCSGPCHHENKKRKAAHRLAKAQANPRRARRCEPCGVWYIPPRDDGERACFCEASWCR